MRAKALPRWPTASLTARLALLFAAMTASLLIVVGLVMGRAVDAHFRELDDHELSGKLNLIGNLLQRADSPQAWAALPQRLDDAFVGHDTVGVLVRDAEGSVIYAVHVDHFDAAHAAGDALPATGAMWQKGSRHFIGRETLLHRPAAADAPGEPLRVLLSLDISHHVHFLEQVRVRLWLGIALSAVVSALLGWLAAHKGLAPLRQVTDTARQLSAGQLGVRLVEGDAPAEVRELVEAFNGMLARLEGDFRRLSEFSADIAHELRTPISNLMTQTSVALSQTRTADDYREVLASNLEEYQRIARMVSDMLFLAQAENGRLPRPEEAVVLADELRALVDFYEALAEAQQVTMMVQGAATVTGDRLMLRRAVSNLLSNALRHTAPGGRIDIRLDCQAGRVRLSVSNPGEPVPPDQLARIFERFHRAGAERSRHGEGAGLGLAITRSIVETHGGRITVQSADGLTTFCIDLPQRLTGA